MLIPFPSSTDLTEVHKRIHRLESAVAATVASLESIAAVLESKLGPGALPAELQSLLADSDFSTPLAAIDQLVRQGQHPAAAREVRDLFQVSWDEAHALVKGWNGLSRVEQLRAAKLARFLHRLDGSSPATT
jgi:hypothetical protein